jgi:RNA polymerase sigma factor (sigma-70 family)
MEADNKKLIEQLKAGDNKAARTFMNKHKDIVTAHVLSNTGTRAHAEDVLQEGFLRLLLKIQTPEIHSVKNLDGYFITICKNLWNKYLRHRKNQKKYVTNEQVPNSEEIDNDNGPETKIEERKDHVMQMLPKLPEECQQILLMRMYGYSFKAILMMVKFKTEGAVRNQNYECIKKLRKLIKRQ